MGIVEFIKKRNKIKERLLGERKLTVACAKAENRDEVIQLIEKAIRDWSEWIRVNTQIEKWFYKQYMKQKESNNSLKTEISKYVSGLKETLKEIKGAEL